MQNVRLALPIRGRRGGLLDIRFQIYNLIAPRSARTSPVEGNRHSAITADGPALPFSSRGISRCADWPRCGLALAQSFRGRTPPDPQLSSGCLWETGNV